MATSFKNVKNNAAGSLTSAITDTASAFSLSASEGDKFPTSNFWVTIENEIVLVSTRSGGSFTGVTRGTQGTTAVAHGVDAPVRLLWTAQHVNDIHTAINAIENDTSGLTGANGITRSGSQFRLGGALAANTSVTSSGYDLTFGSLTIKSTGHLEISSGNLQLLAGNLTITGDLTLSGATRRIKADFSSGDADRTYIQTTTTSAGTQVGVIASGNDQWSEVTVQNYSTTTDSQLIGMGINSTWAGIWVGRRGTTKSHLPLRLYTGGADRVIIHAGGGVSIGNSTDPGTGNLTLSGRITSVGSTTVSTNLNADLLDGRHGTGYMAVSNSASSSTNVSGNRDGTTWTTVVSTSVTPGAADGKWIVIVVGAYSADDSPRFRIRNTTTGQINEWRGVSAAGAGGPVNGSCIFSNTSASAQTWALEWGIFGGTGTDEVLSGTWISAMWVP